MKMGRTGLGSGWLALLAFTTACDDDSGAGTKPDADVVDMDAGGGQSDSGARAPEASVPDADVADTGPGPVACNASEAPDLSGLSVEVVVSGLENLVYAAQPPDSDDWYLVQQNGIVRVFADGALKSAAFLDLSDDMGPPNQGERGLLSIAFASDYADSGRFYVMGTPTKGSAENRDTVYTFTRSASDPYLADPDSQDIVLQLPASQGNHNGGTALFGPDGMLYVGTGDGGGGCNDDQPGAPQDVGSLFGKILRLDLSSPPDYAAAGNPFPTSGNPLVLHYGLRNPFRFSFDRATGDLYLGDVGQGSFEELDFAASGAKGLNFGWAAFEANAQTCTNPVRELAPDSEHTAPLLEIDRRGQDSASVIGGVVYRGSAIPKLRGVYLYADFYGTHMGGLIRCEDGVSPPTPLRKRCDPNFDEACLPASAAIEYVAAFVEDHAGEVYIPVNYDTLLKLVPAP